MSTDLTPEMLDEIEQALERKRPCGGCAAVDDGEADVCDWHEDWAVRAYPALPALLAAARRLREAEGLLERERERSHAGTVLMAGYSQRNGELADERNAAEARAEALAGRLRESERLLALALGVISTHVSGEVLLIDEIDAFLASKESGK